MIRLSDLSRMQIRAMIRLDDGVQHKDSVGVLLDSLPTALAASCYRLEELGLVEFHEGWRGATWVRLTEKGRKVREEGEA